MLSRLKNHDWLITIIVLILLGLSLIVIYSATINIQSGDESQKLLLTKQLIFIVTGMSVYFGISLIDFSWFKNPAILKLLYGLTIVLLVLVKLIGTTYQGAKRWIDLGFFSFQPSEYAKIVLILVTAGIFTISTNILEGTEIRFNKKRTGRIKSLGKSVANITQYLNDYPEIKQLLLAGSCILPIVALVFLQPALGTAMITFILWLLLVILLFPEQLKLLVFIASIVLTYIVINSIVQITLIDTEFSVDIRTSINWLLIIPTVIFNLILIFWTKLKWQLAIIAILTTVTIISGFVYSWNHGVVKIHQKERIIVFISGPEADPEDTGYQVIQSMIAVGSGRLYGKGFLAGTQSSNNFLTQAYNDFAFATLAEQFGFIGSLLLFGLYLALLVRIIKIAELTPDRFSKGVSLGIALLVLIHVFINIGMNMGKLPVTGIPLPLVSYGGSSVFVNLILLGLVQSIARSIRPVDIADNLMLTSHELILRSK